MLREELGVCLEDWKVCLEEEVDNGQVLMRITGRDVKENWIRSSPVKEVFLTFYGWQVITEQAAAEQVTAEQATIEQATIEQAITEQATVENPARTWLLRPDNERIRGERGLWGSLREQWFSLAQRLPGKLRLFACLWEDPPGLFWEDREEDRESLEDWSRKYGIEMDFQTLYLYTICIDKSRRERGEYNMQKRWEWKKKGGFFLCLNDDRAYCFEDLLTNEKAVWTEWCYISQEITGKGPSLIHVRANYECNGSPWMVYLTVSYRLLERDRIELVKASCRFCLREKVIHYWTREEKRLPDWFLNREIYLCNAGTEILHISGAFGETALHPGKELLIKMEDSL